MRKLIFVGTFYLINFLYFYFFVKRKNKNASFLFPKITHLAEAEELFEQKMKKLFLFSVFEFFFSILFLWKFNWTLLIIPILRIALIDLLFKTESLWVNFLLMMTGLEMFYLNIKNFNQPVLLDFKSETLYLVIFIIHSINLTRALIQMRKQKIIMYVFFLIVQ